MAALSGLCISSSKTPNKACVDAANNSTILVGYGTQLRWVRWNYLKGDLWKGCAAYELRGTDVQCWDFVTQCTYPWVRGWAWFVDFWSLTCALYLAGRSSPSTAEIVSFSRWWDILSIGLWAGSSTARRLPLPVLGIVQRRYRISALTDYNVFFKLILIINGSLFVASIGVLVVESWFEILHLTFVLYVQEPAISLFFPVQLVKVR